MNTTAYSVLSQPRNYNTTAVHCSVPLRFQRASSSHSELFIIISMKIEIIAGRLCLLFLIAFLSRCLPAQSVPPTLILSTLTRPVRAAATIGTPPAIQIQRTEPYIQSFHIHSDIQYRYSRTKVQSTVVNPSTRESHEVAFQVTLPDTAFISKFSM